MKHLFIMLALGCSFKAISQDNADISKLLQPYQLPKKTAESSVNNITPYYIGNMPNAFKRKLPAPKLEGKTTNGLEIYILPVDNMRVAKPDSSFTSNMPNALLRRR